MDSLTLSSNEHIAQPQSPNKKQPRYRHRNSTQKKTKCLVKGPESAKNVYESKKGFASDSLINVIESIDSADSKSNCKLEMDDCFQIHQRTSEEPTASNSDSTQSSMTSLPQTKQNPWANIDLGALFNKADVSLTSLNKSPARSSKNEQSKKDSIVSPFKETIDKSASNKSSFASSGSVTVKCRNNAEIDTTERQNLSVKKEQGKKQKKRNKQIAEQVSSMKVSSENEDQSLSKRQQGPDSDSNACELPKIECTTTHSETDIASMNTQDAVQASRKSKAKRNSAKNKKTSNVERVQSDDIELPSKFSRQIEVSNLDRSEPDQTSCFSFEHDHQHVCKLNLTQDYSDHSGRHYPLKQNKQNYKFQRKQEPTSRYEDYNVNFTDSQSHGGLQLQSQAFDGKQFIASTPQEFYIGNNVIFSNSQAQSYQVHQFQPIHSEEYKTVTITEETTNEDGLFIPSIQVQINYHESSVHQAVNYAISEMRRKRILQVPAQYLEQSLTFYLDEIRKHHFPSLYKDPFATQLIIDRDRNAV